MVIFTLKSNKKLYLCENIAQKFFPLVDFSPPILNKKKSSKPLKLRA
jgi:hypothetical protein